MGDFVFVSSCSERDEDVDEVVGALMESKVMYYSFLPKWTSTSADILAYGFFFFNFPGEEAFNRQVEEASEQNGLGVFANVEVPYHPEAIRAHPERKAPSVHLYV